MTALQLSRREEYLLDAALNPDAAVAAASWERWASEIQLEDAPYPELRLLTAVYAHLSRVAPALKLPSKLRGKARATFAANNMVSTTRRSAGSTPPSSACISRPTAATTSVPTGRATTI